MLNLQIYFKETFRACADIKITTDLQFQYDFLDGNHIDQAETDFQQIRFKKLI